MTIGPVFAPRTSSATEVLPAQNDGPDITLLAQDGSLEQLPIMMNASSRHSVTVLATDAEKDPLTIGIIPDMLPPSAVTMIDHGNGTATITLDPSGMGPGLYTFTVTASDGQNEIVREPYGVVVVR